MNEMGMKTAMKTTVEVMTAAVMSCMAEAVASAAFSSPSSILACTASTTTMASSTTVPMTKINAKSVSRLRLKPNR